MAWRLPAVGRITSPYGPRNLPGAVSNFHYGVDIGSQRGPVYAAQDGVVRSIWQTALGAWVLDIQHANEGGRPIRTRYIHMYRNEIVVSVGQRVSGGQRVGNSGASGTGAAHLHFETMVNGSLVDPVPFMAARGVRLGVSLIENPIGGGGNIPTVPDITPIDPVQPITMKENIVNVVQAINDDAIYSTNGIFKTHLKNWDQVKDALRIAGKTKSTTLTNAEAQALVEVVGQQTIDRFVEYRQPPTAKEIADEIWTRPLGIIGGAPRTAGAGLQMSARAAADEPVV